MKYLVKKSALLALFGGLALPAAAQTTGAAWRPFRVGHTYYYAAGAGQDSLLSARLMAPTVVGGDTVWAFEPIVKRPDTVGTVIGCNGQRVWSAYRLTDVTPFGAALVARPAGVYELMATGGSVKTIHTREAVGGTWVFEPGTTATLTTRTMAPVALAAGSVQDSVQVITLSGQTTGQFVLSKQYGLVSTPLLFAAGTLPTPPLALYAIPERGLGLPPNHPWRVHDFQPGDAFAYHYVQEGMNSPGICQERYTMRIILGRQLNAASDTLYYDVVSQTQYNDFSSPNNPFCTGSGPSSTTSVPTRSRFGIARNQQPQSYSFTELIRAGSYATGPTGQQASINSGVRKSAPVRGDASRPYISRVEQELWLDTCTSSFSSIIDSGRRSYFAEGIGLTLSLGFGMALNTDSLVWYQKNGQAHGSLAHFPRQLLTAPALLPASAVQLFPNPATTTARLHLTGTKGGALSLTATDALGRRVWQHTQTIGPDADLALPTASWAPGVYYVRVALPEGARTIRVVRE